MEYIGYYFKDRPYGESLLSGLPLPKDADNVVRRKTFISCEFHSNCRDVVFQDCIFEKCYGDDELNKH